MPNLPGKNWWLFQHTWRDNLSIPESLLVKMLYYCGQHEQMLGYVAVAI
jgi:hypothetical protein